MPNFKYKAISQSGAEVSGVIEAYDEFEAVDAIKRTHVVVTQISQVDGEKFSLNVDITTKKIKEANLALMCSQFAIVLKAGMPIVRSVELIAAQTQDKELRKLLASVAEDVAAGYSLAASFENKGAKTLPSTFIETVRAGEESGTLEISFSKLHIYFDRSSKTKKKVRSAMMYPAFLSVLAVIVIAIVLGVAMPVFLEMFKGMNIELPGPTRFLIAASDFFAQSWLVLVVVIIALAIGLKLWSKNEKGRLLLARFQLKLPVLGKLALMRGSSQFANTMATMLTSGLPIVKAVILCGRVLDNYYLGTQLSAAAVSVEEGKPLGFCLGKCGCFPELLVEMTSVGDETGSLESTLETIGEYFSSETEIASERALNTLQPAITIVMGVVIGFIVIALYLPMFSLYSAL